jgi:hypothetical protein
VAIEDEIRAAEDRLGLRLPPSYRSHLLAAAPLPGDHGLTLLSPSEIDRLEHLDPAGVAAWMVGVQSVPAPPPGTQPLPDDPMDPATMPHDQLGDTIVVSTTDDMRVLLLNPARIDASGEWEAWDFATWYPGAYRYPSFGRLIAAIGQDE